MPHGDENEILRELANEMPGDDLKHVKPPPDVKTAPRCLVTLRCENAYLSRSQEGRKQLISNWQILSCSAGEEYVGLSVFKGWGLDRFQKDKAGNLTGEQSKNWPYFIRDLDYLQVAPPENIMVDIPRICNELQGIVAEATMQPNSDKNFGPKVYFNAGARKREMESGSGPQVKDETPF